MDCNCEGYIGRVYRVISEAYPSTARSRITSSLDFCLPFPRRMHGGCYCCHSETVSFVVSLLSRNVPCECSISEGLAIVPLTRHRFLTKRGQFNGCLHAHLHENVLATENPENRRAYSSAFSSKIWYSRVICVFLRWGLTCIFDMYYGVNCPLKLLNFCTHPSAL